MIIPDGIDLATATRDELAQALADSGQDSESAQALADLLLDGSEPIL